MAKRVRPPLSDEDRALWAAVARGVVPLKGRPVSLEVARPAPPAKPDPASAARAPAKALPTSGNPSAPPTLPPLAPLERRLTTALRRGTRATDARIDLHGLRQDEAHRALASFLHRSQGAGLRLVLVVTGKGGSGIEGAFSERGVLRRSVPHWLRLPDMRSLVLGFEEAPQRHGGAGALIVRLRRSRTGDRPGLDQIQPWSSRSTT